MQTRSMARGQFLVYVKAEACRPFQTTPFPISHCFSSTENPQTTKLNTSRLPVFDRVRFRLFESSISALLQFSLGLMILKL
ncbi:hypothetical protein ABKV19_027356 [Rosa sericea]